MVSKCIVIELHLKPVVKICETKVKICNNTDHGRVTVDKKSQLGVGVDHMFHCTDKYTIWTLEGNKNVCYMCYRLEQSYTLSNCWVSQNTWYWIIESQKEQTLILCHMQHITLHPHKYQPLHFLSSPQKSHRLWYKSGLNYIICMYTLDHHTGYTVVPTHHVHRHSSVTRE